jgi:hypothetical protein
VAEVNTVSVDLHVKRYSDFDLIRIAKAATQDYEGLVTAFLVNVHIHACSAVGVVFSHICPGPYDRFSDGHLRSAWKAGWRRLNQYIVLDARRQHSVET